MRSIVRAAALLIGLHGAARAQPLTMGGGFVGGTFNGFVDGIVAVLDDLDGVTVVPTTSAGSVENRRRDMAGEMDMGVALAGDAYVPYDHLEAFDDDDDESSVAGVRAIGYLDAAVS